MKKMVALALAITMLVSLASVASASKSINLNVSCTSTTNYARSNETEKKNTDSKMIYVRHFDNVDTETSLDKGTQRKTTENELPSLTQCTA